MTAATDEGGRTPEQVKKDLATDNAVPTASTASGLAALGSPGGKETAKSDESNSGIQPDAVKDPAAPIGQQQDAAFFTRNGSIPANSVPSPSGPVPASTIADEATRNAAVEAAREGARHAHQGGRTSRFRISDEAAERISPATLRAVALDRGYKDVEGGRQSVLRKFLEAQKKDEGLDDPPEGHEFAPVTAPVASVPLAGGNPLMTPSAPGGLKNTDGSPASATPPTEPKK